MINDPAAGDPNPTPPDPRAEDGSRLVPLRDAEHIVDALNRVLELDLSPRERARALLEHYQKLLGREYDVQLMLFDDLARPAGPHIIERVTIGPTLDQIEPRPAPDVQGIVDSWAPAVRMILHDALSNLRTPRVFVIGQDLPEEQHQWYREHVVENHMAKIGWSDLMIACWASGPDRLISVVVYNRPGWPDFGPEERQLASLMLRATAPMIHRELLDNEGEDEERAGEPSQSPLAGRALSIRQRDVLRLLLRGHSEKEVARDLGVSTHTVHTHVKRLYGEFEVSSRGELLALFIDRRVLAATDS